MKFISVREFRDAPKKYYKEALKQTVVLRMQGGIGLKLVPVILEQTLTVKDESTKTTKKVDEKQLDVTAPNSETAQQPTNEAPKQESKPEEPKSENYLLSEMDELLKGYYR